MQIMTKSLLLLLGVLVVGHTQAETLVEKRERLKQEEASKQQEEKQRQSEKRRAERIRQKQEEDDRQAELARQRQIERDRIAREQAEQAAEAARQKAARERAAMGIDMVRIPAGSFAMGCENAKCESSETGVWIWKRTLTTCSKGNDCYPSENPVHTVSLAAFELGKTEVTQGQWKAVMGGPPPELAFKDCGDTCPVERVSWNDVQTFIQKLNAQTGKTYRLPSEAEWEYACRAGQSSNYCGGDNVDNVAWYNSNSGGKMHPVGGKQANAWGLYDMSGNVYEWVQDPWHSDYKGAPTDGSAWQDSSDARVLRGGSWNGLPRNVRAANRGSFTATGRDVFFGFRLARTLP
ncbi:MAG: SUMF1/EgtB/PvdO family nonheme iron enzyme [Gallionella sp.]|nr:SUMF1/EgtB/PvdO family nonheme iron enzyme [Gallionella sp.]